MTKIRNLTYTWAKTTWQKQLSSIAEKPKIKKKLSNVLKKFGLTKEYVTGESVTGLKRTAEELFVRGLNISYSKAFDQAYSKNPKKLPILFLWNLALKFDFKSAKQERFEGLMARGLRTFPSLLRDRDFGENLKRILQGERFRTDEFKVIVDPEEDIPHHTDVLLCLRGQEYRIWLYQFTPRGLPHDIERVLGKRGELPSGIHALCPLNTRLALEKEKLQKRLEWLKSRLASWNEKYERYKTKTSQGAMNCRKKSQQLRREVKETEILLKKKTVVTDKEIFTANGWYFYSEEKVKSVAKLALEVSLKKTSPDSYSKVHRILMGPEKYLGKIRFFSKSD